MYLFLYIFIILKFIYVIFINKNIIKIKLFICEIIDRYLSLIFFCYEMK